MSIIRRPLIALAAAFLLAGCAHSQPQADDWRLEAMEKSLAQLQERMAKLEEQQAGPSRPREALMGQADGQGSAAVQESAPAQEPSAVQEPSQATASAQDLASSLEKKSGSEWKASDTAPPPASSSAPRRAPASPKPARTERQAEQGPAKLYNEALRLAEADKSGPAREKFKTFMDTYPDSSLMPNAHYWLGETYYQDKQYADAILSFKEVREKYPKHQKAADAMLKLGYTYDRLGDKDNAAFYLKALVDEYPGTRAAGLAKTKLKELGR